MAIYHSPYLMLNLVCDWCNTRNDFCLACTGLYQQRQGILEHRGRFVALLDAANKGDAVAALAASDWLKENGVEFDEEGD